MNDESDLNDNQPTSSRVPEPGNAPPPGHGFSPQPNGHRVELNGHSHTTSQLKAADFWWFLAVLKQRRSWIVAGGIAAALLGLVGGRFLWQTNYSASTQLVRYDSPEANELFGQRQIAQETLIGLLRSPELLHRVGLPPDGVRITPERNSDIIIVDVPGTTASNAVALANRYGSEAIHYTQEEQARNAREMADFIAQQLDYVETELLNTNSPATAVPIPALLAATPRKSAVLEKLQAANLELAELLGRFTDAHPLVQAQRARIAALQGQFTEGAVAGAGPSAAGLPVTTTNVFGEADDPIIIRGKTQLLENARLTLRTRQRAARAFQENPPGLFELLAPATPDSVVKNGSTAKTLLLAVFAGLLGLAGGVITVLLIEFLDERLKTVADVARVTRLPVLATADDLSEMTEVEQRNWAFRTWTILRGRLSPSPNHGLVCGVTSANHGEGRSTWVNLLAEAANQCGFRVLTITTRPTRNHNGHASADVMDDGNGAANPAAGLLNNTLAASMLFSPGEVAEQLAKPDASPFVHIPLPGWVWDLKRRKQWQAAMQHWSGIENIAIFVELPPASVPEAVLLAENLPNLLWFTDSSKATANQTREYLDTLRHAHCRLAGAVLNHNPQTMAGRFTRWVGCGILLCALGVGSIRAQDNPAPSDNLTNELANTNLSFSVSTPVKRAPWQEKFTLGPGDQLNLSVYGDPETIRQEIAIGPDGHISYLEAQDVPAAGLTIDELRVRLDQELAKYRRSPHTIVTPVAFHSKKYYVFGRVTQRGAFTLDRPTTIIEAVALARGLETGSRGGDNGELADFANSFLIRHGQRLPVDFDRLFRQGDLSQNIMLEPEDYLYFPAVVDRDIYILGEVRVPGSVAYHPHSGATTVIAMRGGFAPKAWKQNILVVRGSLNKPQLFTVNVADVLAAKTPDFELQPGDMVYVSGRPWFKGEQLLDAAASAFVEAVVITGTGKWVTH